ncbi:MAG: YvcK family protein [Candidatus Moranbacteria bacterium]|nr:YvcK family protein [Candidatus Moranbacteria bacterium]
MMGEIRKKIVTIGGGTGSFTLLSGLKKYPVDISAIVSMADDGGSTGVLRDELGVLPPGDVRQCLVALSESSETLRELMGYRFEEGGLKGHSFGNLFLSALEKVEGSFSRGVEEASKILNIKGEVIPVSEDSMKLHIGLKNGKVLIGENNLDHNEEIRKIGIEKVFLKPRVSACKKALEKIRQADMIVIGPGDMYGSILPIFLVREIADAIRKSKAKIVFNCNLTNKRGQTENFTIDDYVRVAEEYIGKKKIGYVTFNSKRIPADLVRKYESHEGKGSVIKFHAGYDRRRSFRVVTADVLNANEPARNKNDLISASRAFIRHDSDKLAKVIMMLLEIGDYEKIIKGIF